MLYAAFSEDWQGDERMLHVAFQQFSEALVADGDWGYRHLEVCDSFCRFLAVPRLQVVD
jgi:hypothetical protein